MTDVTKCDGCGKVVDRETLDFRLVDKHRIVSGDFSDHEGTRHEWDHADLSGDLCGECAAPIIEQLNEVLRDE